MNSPMPGDPGVILIADDNSEARRMLEMRVKREGHRAILVENGREALEVLGRESVDVLLLDINMPELDGFGVLAAVRADPALAHIPILIISGGGDHDDLVRCIEMGAVDYLSKPFNQAVLRARLGACIASKRTREQELRLLHQARPALADTRILPEPGSPDGAAPRAAAAPAAGRATQRCIGRIKLDRTLGRGAIGEVFLGHHDLLDLPVAVKLLRPELLLTPEARVRFLQEARIAARIAHRHVVRLYEVGETGSSIYLAFEYVDGGTLADRLERSPQKQLPISEAVRVTCEIASALAEAQRVGIIHRDIKPSNILLTRAGEVKVADLGLAKQPGAETPDANLTAAHAIVGTPLYMSPEQAKHGSRLDIRTDLYSLGVVLYQMLTGVTPFQPGMVGDPKEAMDSAIAILFHQMHTPPPPLAPLRPDLPAWLEALCMKLLAKSPDDRPASPEALWAELDRRTSPIGELRR